MAIKAVIFDFADTLVHTERFNYNLCLLRMHQSLSKGGISVPFKDFKQGYFDSRDRFYKETEESLEEQNFAERIREALKSCGVMLYANDKRVPVAAKAFVTCFVNSLTIDRYLPSLLKQLNKKYKLAVVSNMSFAEAGSLSLKKLNIAKHFDAVIISGILGWRKPGPKIFQQALKDLNIRAEEAVFVGDSPKADIEGAKQLGMKTILVMEKNRTQPSTDTFQFYIKESHSAVKPDKTITKLAEIPETLESLD